MKMFISAVSIAAIMATGSYALAQDAGVNANAGAGVKVETPAMGEDANAAAGATVDATTSATTGTTTSAGNTFGSVMSSLSTSASTDLSAITADSQVSIVLLSSLDSGAEASSFDDALKADAEGQAKLHANIEANAAIKAKLEAEGHSVDDVVAVQSNADGSIVVYVDDRA